MPYVWSLPHFIISRRVKLTCLCRYCVQARLKNPGNEDLWLAAVRTELRAEKKKDAEVLVAKALQVSHFAEVHLHFVDTEKHSCTCQPQPGLSSALEPYEKLSFFRPA